ncbi:hypothetical protein KQ310_03790 [Synechococcus sp. CS-1328]|nr:hypothetical protein [Synechococcus sp. CS-1328]
MENANKTSALQVFCSGRHEENVGGKPRELQLSTNSLGWGKQGLFRVF